TPLAVSATRNGPKGLAAGRPSMSVRNVADRSLSRHQTMVWFSWMLMAALLQVQVNLKARGWGGFVGPHGRLPHTRRGCAREGRPGLGAPLLRGPGPDQVETRGLGPPSLPARGAATDRLHRLRPAPRLDARRDRRRARKAAVGSRAHRPALVPSLARMGLADRRADRRAPAAQARSRRVHRLWLPPAPAVPARQSRRPRRRPRGP